MVVHFRDIGVPICSYYHYIFTDQYLLPKRAGKSFLKKVKKPSVDGTSLRTKNMYHHLYLLLPKNAFKEGLLARHVISCLLSQNPISKETFEVAPTSNLLFCLVDSNICYVYMTSIYRVYIELYIYLNVIYSLLIRWEMKIILSSSTSFSHVLPKINLSKDNSFIISVLARLIHLLLVG